MQFYLRAMRLILNQFTFIFNYKCNHIPQFKKKKKKIIVITNVTLNKNMRQGDLKVTVGGVSE